jgi:hypothetical protein
MFRRTIAVLDLGNGRVTRRASGTMTFDVPADFDRKACVASIDTRARAHYLSTAGSTLLNPAFPRPLSWRARGEVCLVAAARGHEEEVAFRLCAVDPMTG